MAGFDPGSFKIGSERSANCATTTQPTCQFSFKLCSKFCTNSFTVVFSTSRSLIP